MAIGNLSWMVIICLLPQLLRAINQVQVIKGKLDPKWSNYLGELAGDYDESPPQEGTSRHPLTEKQGWSLSRSGESDFVVVIHRKTSAAPFFSLAAGDACGGALVALDKLITYCACLASWYPWMKSGAKGKVVPGSVKSAYDIIAETIYVTHTTLEFIPDFLTQLSTNATSTPEARCPTNAADSDARMADVLIVRFTPGILQETELMPWPPFPIAADKSLPENETGIVMAFGMTARNNKRFFDEFGSEILISSSSVKFRVRSTSYSNCARNPSLWKTLPKELLFKVNCFNSTNNKFDLCSGLVGSPVMLEGAIHGLMMSNITCGTSFSDLLALSFDAKTREFIEQTAGKELTRKVDVLIDDTDGKAKEVFYRDAEPLQQKTPQSLSVRLDPFSDDILVVILPSMIISLFKTVPNIHSIW
uniref:Uncharacterized protein n=1 Tax=Lygus hesperus TaxID=30085 RepID=A0A146LA29_LYGHE